MTNTPQTLYTPTQRTSQAGIVSILVTMIMMLVISLIVLGFAQVSRREQRQSLDRQLSTQAFFAAESAVNIARDVVATNQAKGFDIPEKPGCGVDPAYDTSNIIDAANAVSYPCLLVTTRLNYISINPLSADSTSGSRSQNTTVEAFSGTINKIHINWDALNAPDNSAIAKCGKKSLSGYFPASDPISNPHWTCPYGVLRADIIPINTGPAFNRINVASSQKTLFFYPVKGGSGATVAWNNANGAVPIMNCSILTGCDIDITGVSGGASYAVRLTALYSSGKVKITAQESTTDLELKNAQIQIDATGKAQGVLRRIQVRLPIAQSAKTPDYAVASASSICKRFEFTPTTFSVPADINGQDQANPMCNQFAIVPATPAIPATSTSSVSNNAGFGRAISNGIPITHPYISWTAGFRITSVSKPALSCTWYWEWPNLTPFDTRFGAQCNPIPNPVAGPTGDPTRIVHSWNKIAACTPYIIRLQLVFADQTSLIVNPDRNISLPYAGGGATVPLPCRTY